MVINVFENLQKNQNEELTKCCETFFDLLDNFAETRNKHRHAIWPLQMMLLILTPRILEEINNADSGIIMLLCNISGHTSEKPGFWERVIIFNLEKSTIG